MQRVQTLARYVEPSFRMRIVCRFGRETLGVLLFACETLWPTRRPFPQISQVRGMAFLRPSLKKSASPSTSREERQDKSRENKDLGRSGEKAAAAYLQKQGFRIIGRNVRYPQGEIDIVASYRGELHFVEVRTRRDARFCTPLESITEEKKRRVRMAAQCYLAEGRWKQRREVVPACHFDVIGIEGDGEEERLECILDAFE